MLTLISSNHTELRDQAICVLTCFTALRAEDVHSIFMRMIQALPATKDHGRRYRIILDHTKNDRAGTGPVEGRTFLVPCTCMVNLEKGEKAAFARSMKAKPFCSCIEPCPFDIVARYLAACPSPVSSSSAVLDSPFARAVSARGDPRVLVSGQLGIQEIRKAIVRVNERLPADVQLQRATGHSGRNTLATLAMNNGADTITTAAATKHRDPKSLKGYVRGETGVLMGAAMHVAQALPSSKGETRLAGVALADDVQSASTTGSVAATFTTAFAAASARPAPLGSASSSASVAIHSTAAVRGGKRSNPFTDEAGLDDHEADEDGNSENQAPTVQHTTVKKSRDGRKIVNNTFNFHF